MAMAMKPSRERSLSANYLQRSQKILQKKDNIKIISNDGLIEPQEEFDDSFRSSVKSTHHRYCSPQIQQRRKDKQNYQYHSQSYIENSTSIQRGESFRESPTMMSLSIPTDQKNVLQKQNPSNSSLKPKQTIQLQPQSQPQPQPQLQRDMPRTSNEKLSQSNRSANISRPSARPVPPNLHVTTLQPHQRFSEQEQSSLSMSAPASSSSSSSVASSSAAASAGYQQSSGTQLSPRMTKTRKNLSSPTQPLTVPRKDLQLHHTSSNKSSNRISPQSIISPIEQIRALSPPSLTLTSFSSSSASSSSTTNPNHNHNHSHNQSNNHIGFLTNSNSTQLKKNSLTQKQQKDTIENSSLGRRLTVEEILHPPSHSSSRSSSSLPPTAQDSSEIDLNLVNTLVDKFYSHLQTRANGRIELFKKKLERISINSS